MRIRRVPGHREPGTARDPDRLRDGEQPVLALAEPFAMTLPAVSQQLRIAARGAV
jgi:hypothetical protein